MDLQGRDASARLPATVTGVNRYSLASLAGALSLTHPAGAEEALTWRAPSACSRERFLRAVPSWDRQEPMDIQIEAHEKHLYGRLRLRGVSREVDAQSCGEAIDALALVTAMILDTVPSMTTVTTERTVAAPEKAQHPKDGLLAPEPSPRTTPQPYRSATWAWVGAGGGVMGGHPAWEFAAGIHHSGRGPITFVMGGDVTSRTMSFVRDPYDVHLQWVSLRFTAGASFALLPSFTFDVGGFAELGLNWAPTVRGPLDASTTLGWASTMGPMGRLRVMVLPTQTFSPLLGIEVSNLIALTRHRFFVEEGPELLSLRAVNLSAKLLLGVTF